MSSAARVSSSKGGAVGAILGCFEIRGMARGWHALLSEAILLTWPALRSPVTRYAARPPDVRSWRCSTSSDAGGRCASSGNSTKATPRFADLAHRCDDVSSSVLRDRLRDLTAAGIVERGDGGYRLTADGRELMELLRPLGQWSQRWARRTYAADSGHPRSSTEEVR